MNITLTNARTQHILQRTPEGIWRASEGNNILLTVCASTPVEIELSGDRQPLSSMRLLPSGQFETQCVFPVHTWAGQATLRCKTHTEEVVCFLDVSPHPDKLGSVLFGQMLEELSELAQAMPYGFSAGAAQISKSDAFHPITYPFVLETHLPLLLQALERWKRRLLRLCVRERHMAPWRQGRRLDAATLGWLARHPKHLAIIHAQTQGKHTSTTRTSISQSLTFESLSHPANRYIVGELWRLRSSLKASHNRFEDAAQGRGAIKLNRASKARARQLGALVSRAHRCLEKELSTQPLREIPPSPPTAGAIQAIADHPLSAGLLRILKRLLLFGGKIEEEGNHYASLRHTYDLFELLVLHRLMATLPSLTEAAVSWQSAVVQQQGLLVEMPQGEVLRGCGPGEKTIVLCFQHRFASIHRRGMYKAQSITAERIPDYTLALYKGSNLKRWYLLDAKYRASRSAIHKGLADMHMYRDSLRLHGKRAEGGFLLVPSVCEKTATFSKYSYLTTHATGIIDANPEALHRALFHILFPLD